MKIEFTVEIIENGYVLRWIDGLVNQFSHARYYKSPKYIADAIELLLSIKKDEQ